LTFSAFTACISGIFLHQGEQVRLKNRQVRVKKWVFLTQSYSYPYWTPDHGLEGVLTFRGLFERFPAVFEPKTGLKTGFLGILERGGVDF
jgi:hypothetical protein